MDYHLNMAPKNINFKLLSLNARGSRSFEKRKAMFGWLIKNNADIVFDKNRTAPLRWKMFGNLNEKDGGYG